jgi:hypothetical protein
MGGKEHVEPHAGGALQKRHGQAARSDGAACGNLVETPPTGIPITLLR